MDIALYILIALVFGFAALVLVSGELSRRLGLTTAGRVILAGMMGFGVLGVSVKAVLILLLEPPPALARVSDVTRSLAGTEKQTGSIVPRGLPYSGTGRAWRPLPPAPALSEAAKKKAVVGRRLYFDKRLSATGTVACASCHVIGLGGDDGKRRSTGIRGLEGSRNAPTVLNAAYLRRLFWDGRAVSLADQAKGPLINPVEMGLKSLDEAVAIVARDPEYVRAFQDIYAAPLDIEQVAEAIAIFERTLITEPSPYDRFVAGDEAALSPSQLRGMMLFEEVGCRNCHEDPWFSVAGDARTSPYRVFPLFRDSIYLARYNLLEDKGRNEAGIWRVPSLRNVELTAPYFHNGSVDTLEEAVRVMASVQRGRTLIAEAEGAIDIRRDQEGRPQLTRSSALTEQDIRDLADFLRSLTGEPPPVEDPWQGK